MRQINSKETIYDSDFGEDQIPASKESDAKLEQTGRG